MRGKYNNTKQMMKIRIKNKNTTTKPYKPIQPRNPSQQNGNHQKVNSERD